LLQALAAQGRDVRIDEIMRRSFPAVQETDMLEQTFRAMSERGYSALPVVHNQQLVGLLTLENVGELVMVRSAMRDGHRPPGQVPFQQPN